MTTTELDSLKALMELADLIERAQTAKLITPEERTQAYTKIYAKVVTEFNTLLP